jgi:diguanylate cyclase (GGDEF)-like protein/putative nucleotidyltransferase with HDIG domain
VGDLSIRAKVTLFVLGLALFSTSLECLLTYRSISDLTWEQLRGTIGSLATAASMLVDPDDHARLQRPQDRGSPAFKRIQGKLRAFSSSNPRVHEIYTLVPTKDPNKFRFIVDAAEPKDTNGDGRLSPDEIPAAVGEPYDVSKFPELKKGLSGSAADTELTSDKWGQWLSGYAPVRDREGKAVAVLGVDMAANDVRTVAERVAISTLVAFIIAAVASVGLGLLIATTLSRPIERLVRAANQVAEGDLDVRLPANGTDEFSKLNETFNRMVSSLSKDLLTGLANRRHFEDRLGREIERCKRKGSNLCVVMMDIDRFKKLNDSLGHAAGDQVLKAFGEVILQVVRRCDVAARRGGDEFTILLVDADISEAVSVAKRLKSALSSGIVAEVARYLPDESALALAKKMTVTLGISEYPTDGSDAETLMSAADLALLHAKHRGGNYISAYARASVNAAGSCEAVGPRINENIWSALETLVAVVDAHAPHVREHSELVSHYAAEIAQQLGLPVEQVEETRMAGLLHDLGKVTLADSLLSRAGPLSEEEWKLVFQHPVAAANIVSKVPLFSNLAEAVRYHHERCDGTGYPEGLKGEEIPLLARIIAVADAYEAMTTLRAYRQSKPLYTRPEAIKVLSDAAGTQFDPMVVEALRAIVQRELTAQSPQVAQVEA